MPTTSDFERQVREAGLRVTRPRLAVLSAVHDHPHLDTDAIIGLVRADLGTVSHQAVYDVLRALTTAGVLRRIEPTGSAARYETRVGDNHHHVVCRSCGAISDVDCVVGAAPCLTASDGHGYRRRRGRGRLLGALPRVFHHLSTIRREPSCLKATPPARPR